MKCLNNSIKSIVVFAFALVLIPGIHSNSYAAVVISTSSGGNWSSGSTWVGNSSPSIGDDVIIATTGGANVYTSSTLTCNSLVVISDAALVISRNFTVTTTTNISGSITFNSNSTTSRTITFNGDVTLNNGSGWSVPSSGNGANNKFVFGGNFTNNASTFNDLGTGVHTFSGTGATIGGSTVTSIARATITGNVTNTGVLTVRTAIAGTGGTLTNASSATLNIKGSCTVTTLVASAVNNQVNYIGAAQTAKVTTYYNLTLAGSLAKTFSTTPTVNGTLSMEGTATVVVSTGVVTYGPNATLQYNTATSRTVSSEEWVSPFTASGGVVIANTGIMIMNSAKVFNASIPLTINSGAALDTKSANSYSLTFGGDFINNGGTLTAYASPIVIANNAAIQSISGFTTTGLVSMTKTAGTATFTGNVSGAALNIGGSAGAVLNLGNGLTHIFTGDINFLGTTGATLDGGSSTLYENNMSSTAFGGSATATIRFTASTSTVILGGTSQTICGSNTPTFYNLTVLGSSGKTFTNIPTVTNIFTIGGTCSVSAAPAYGPNATLYYNTSAARTAGVEWITPFVATGGVVIGNTGTITMNAARVFNATAPLTVNSGASLNMSTYLLTLNGNFNNEGGSATGTSGGVTISGTANQTIDGFTTTGTVLMSKTGGIATLTGNINGAALTINGSGGTLNLGVGNNLTFTGIVTLTAGTLNGGNSTLNENAVSANAWSGNGSLFIPADGTVNFGAAGNQTIAANSSFNDLILSGSGAKTFANSTAIVGDLSIIGAVADLAGITTHSANSLTFGSVAQASGSWGSTISSALYKNNTYFLSTSTGIINVNCAAPAPPVSGGNKVICADQAIPTLTVSVGGGETAYWYNQSSGGTLLAGPSLSYTPSSGGTFYAGARSALGCASATRTPVSLTINALPATLVLSTNAICANPGGNGTITSTTSVVGVIYQLFNSANAMVQAAKAGTGSALIWTGLVAGNGYYVVGTRTSTSCSSTSSTVNIISNPNPLPLALTGSAICANPGDDGTITSSTSASGVNYQLYDGANNPVQALQAGTGAALSWIGLNAGNGYYVIGTNATTSCVSPLSNTVNITTVPNPAALVLTGSVICASPDGNGTITSTTSQTGVDYQLYDNNDLEVGDPIPGTGAGLTWTGLISGNGYYAVGTNAVTSCDADNSNTVNITTTPNPTIAAATTAGGVCFSSSAQSSTLSYSATTGSPATYSISWNAAAQSAGLANVPNTALPVSPMVLPVAANVASGIYTGSVYVTNANGCLSTAKSFTLTVNSAPSAPTGSASQVFCSGATVSNLAATGTGILWYAAASGGSALAGSTPLVNGNHYYASQTVGTCESAARLDVTAVVPATGSWIGTTSTNWFTASNWCGGTLPTATTNVVIAAGLANYPSVGEAGAVCNNITIASGASLTITGSNTLTVSGSWTNNGTFAANTSTVVFNGSGAASIASSNFYNVTFSGSGAKSATGPLFIAGNVSVTNNFTAGAFTHTVGGNWSVSGTFTPGGSTIDFNGVMAASISTGSFNNVIFSGSGIKTAAGALAIAGNVTITGNFTAGSYTHTVGGNWTKTGTFVFAGSTINFNGSGSGNIGAGNFNNVIFSGAGAKMAAGNLNILGDVTILNNFGGGSYSHTFQGNWTNNGTFTAGTSTFNFNAATPQNIGGTSVTTFYNFIQSGLGLITLSVSTAVSGTLTLTLGIIDIGNFNLVINYPGTISGGSASSYIKTSGSGRLKQTVPGIGGSRVYPVGNSAYNPMSVQYNDINTSKNFSLRVADAVITNANSTKTVNRQWFLMGDVAGSANLTLTATYNPGEEGVGFDHTANPQIAYFDGTAWAYRPISSGAGTNTFVASGSAPDFTNPNGFFTLGSGDAFVATKLVVSKIDPANPTLGLNNTIITVQSQNSSSVPTIVAVTSATAFELSCANTTMSPATPTGSISQYTYQTTVSSVAFTTSTGGLTNATVTATRTSGDVLAAGTSAPFDVITGSIYEPVATENWDAANGWRMSTDGGITWTNPATLPTGNVFDSTLLIRIPAGITLTANVTASFYSMLVYGTLDISPTGNLTIFHRTRNDDYNLHVHGTLKNSGGTLTNTNSARPAEIHGGTYWHYRDGGSIPVCLFYTLGSTPSTCIVQGTGVGGLNQVFENFTLVSGSQVLTGDMTVNGALTLTAGKITTGSYHVIVSLTGTANNTGAGYINGTLRRYVASNVTTGDFPVGDANYDAPFSIAVNSGTPSGNGFLDVSTATAQPPAESGLSQTKYINRKWTITNHGVAGIITYNPSCTFADADKIGNPATASLKLRKFTNSTWYVTNGTATGNTITATGLSTAGLTATSDFYVGEDDCGLNNDIWLGATNTDWNTGSNWCSGSVPVTTTDVTIPSASVNQPVIGTAGGVCRNISIGGGASLTMTGVATLIVKGNWTSNGTFTPGSGTVSFEGASAQTISGTTTFNNLTINNSAAIGEGNSRVTLSSEGVTVNGILNLQCNNASSTNGALNTGTFTLNMGANATTTGAGDVTGFVKRMHTFLNGVAYSFGSAYTIVTFVSGTSKPAYLTCNIVIGSIVGWPGWSPDGKVKRVYGFAQDGSGTDQVILNLRYLPSEEDNTYNDETKLVIWHQNILAVNPLPHEHGKSNQNLTDHWISFGSFGVKSLASSTDPTTSEWTTAYSLTNKNTWRYSNALTTDWNTPVNWSAGHYPGQTINGITYANDDVLIPGGLLEGQYPVLSSNVELATLQIDGIQNGVTPSVTAGNYTLTINGSNGAWINNGIFNPGTGLVNFTHGNINEIVTASGSGTNQFHNISIAANTFIRPGTGFYMKINGWVMAQLSSVVDLSPAGTTVEYNGTSQTIVNPSHSGYKGYYNLVISGNGTSNLYNGTLDIYGNYTNNGTLNMSGSTVSFIGSVPQTISGTNIFNNLTINNAAGISSASDITVNGILNLQSDNPSLFAGSLAMNSGSVLYMGDTATTLGPGDVTGTITRTPAASFATNTAYSFGNQNTTILFPAVPGQTLPTSATVRVTLGAPTSWTPTNPVNSIRRILDIAQTGGSGTRAILRAHFKANEIPGGVDPISLSFWINKTIAPATYYIYEKGRSNLINTPGYSYIEVQDVDLAVIPANPDDFHAAIAPTASTIRTWNGSISTDWNEASNWTPNGVPLSTYGVIIPDANTTVYDPSLPASGATPQATCQYIVIKSNGILNAGAGATFTLTDGVLSDAWLCEPGGVFNAGNSTVIFNSGASHNASIGGTTHFYNVTIADQSMLQPSTDCYMGISGALTIEGTGVFAAVTNENTIEFDGSSTQLVPQPNGNTPGYHNLILSGSGTKTLPAFLNIFDEFTNNTSAPDKVDALTNNTTVTFNGNAYGQIIGGTTVTTFSNLTLNNSHGLALEGVDAVITGTLSLMNGVISTQANHVTIGPGGNVSGAGAGRYVFGNLQKGIAASTASKTFEIGNATNYLPLTIQFAGTATNGTGSITCNTTNGPQPQYSSSGLNQSKYLNRYWTITNSGVTFGTYDATFTFVNPGDMAGSANPSRLLVNRYSASVWSSTTTNNLSSTTVKSTGNTAFGDFAAGEVLSYATDYFRSATSGNWSSVSTWQTSSDSIVWGQASLVPDFNAHSIMVSSGNIVTLGAPATASNLYLIGTLTSGDGIDLSVAGTWGNSGLFNAGTGTVTFNGSLPQLIIGATTFNNLTISNPTGVTAGGDITVNGNLDLAVANPSATQGALYMGHDPDPEFVLYMGPSSTTTGIGDATGYINRSSFVLGTDYTFGNHYTLMNFTVGPLPTSVTLEIYLRNTDITWKTNAIHRYYDVARIGGSDATRLRFNIHYLDSELNGNSEKDLVLFDYHVHGDEVHDHGRSDMDTIANWVGFANVGITFLGVAVNDDHFWTLADDMTNNICTWLGGSPSGPTDWDLPDNWQGGTPQATSNVTIPGGLTYYPLVPFGPLPDGSQAGGRMINTIDIQPGAVVNATSGTPTLTVNGAATSWNNNGTFNAGASTIVFTNANAMMDGITSFNNVTIADGAALTPVLGNSMRIAGSLSLSTSGVLNAATHINIVEYNGSVQNVIAPNGSLSGYSSLILSGSGVKTMPATPLHVWGDFTVAGTASVTAQAPLLVSGNVAIGPNATFNAGNITHEIGGNWSDSGTFIAAGSTINFNGDVNSTISAGNFYHIIISGNGTKLAIAAITLSGDFELTSGGFAFNNPISNSISIAGNYTQTGGIFDFNNQTSGTCAMSLGGNFTQTSGAESMTTSGAGAYNGVITFNGSTVQTLSFSEPNGAVWVKYAIPSGKSVTLLSDISLNAANEVSEIPWQGEININGTFDLGTHTVTQVEAAGVPGTALFTVNPGATLITANAGGISGSVSQTNIIATYSSSANYEFRGASTGTFVTSPSAATVHDLIINNTSGNVALTNSLQVAGVSSLANGNLQLGSNTLTLAGATPVVTNGSIDASANGSSVVFSGPAMQDIASGLFYTSTVYDLTIANASNVTLNGTLRLLNTLTASAGRLDAVTNSPTVVYAGAASQTIGDQYLNNQVYNLTIDNSNGVSLNTNFTINNNLLINASKLFTVGAGKDLTVSGAIANAAGTAGFVLQSDAAGTASLLHQTDAVPATVQRYISGSAEAWHFLSAPVAGQSISGSWLPSGTYGNGTGYDLYVWNEPSSCWIYKLNTTATINWNTVHPGTDFQVGRGYLYSVQTANPTKIFSGNLNNGALTYPLTVSSTIDSLKGFNLVGNPFPSSVDWKDALGWTRDKLEVTGGGYDVWIWNQAENNYGVYNSNDAVDMGTNSVSRFIAPMQGFFVKAVSDGNLGINNAARVHDGSGTWFKGSETGTHTFSLRVSSDGGLGSDEIKLGFAYPENQNGAQKLFSNQVTAPSLYMAQHKNNLSVRYFTTTSDNPMVPVNFKAGMDGSYTLSCTFDASNFDTVMLQDRQLQMIYDLKAQPVYHFNATVGDAADRFVLYFGAARKGSNYELPARIYVDGTTLSIDLSLVQSETSVMVYDAAGRLLLQKQLTGLSQHSLHLKSPPQVLFLQLRNPEGTMNTKIYYQNNY